MRRTADVLAKTQHIAGDVGAEPPDPRELAWNTLTTCLQAKQIEECWGDWGDEKLRSYPKCGFADPIGETVLMTLRPTT